jgi:hypothetical protein
MRRYANFSSSELGWAAPALPEAVVVSDASPLSQEWLPGLTFEAPMQRRLLRLANLENIFLGALRSSRRVAAARLVDSNSIAVHWKALSGIRLWRRGMAQELNSISNAAQARNACAD